MQNLNLKAINCVAGGINCVVTLTFKKPGANAIFGMSIKDIKKPDGSCRNVISGMSGGSLNIGDQNAKLVCDCKEE